MVFFNQFFIQLIIYLVFIAAIIGSVFIGKALRKRKDAKLEMQAQQATTKTEEI